jgi:hypothetical protein
MDENQKKIIKGMKVRELSSGRIAEIVAVNDKEDEVGMICGSEIGVFIKSIFWDYFEEVES